VSNIEVRALSKSYGVTTVVDGVELSLEHGQLLCLLGPSGCGKSTTLRLLAGFLEPDGGEILVDGRCLSARGRVVPPERRNMSMIFQSYAIWPHMTVFQNVAYGLKLRRVDRHGIEDRVNQMLEVVRLRGLGPRYPSELSGGQQQRVALARALVVEPAILLLDEPLSNLDAHLREEMRFEIRRLHEAYKITTIYVTHDQAEAMVIADRIAVMNRGRIEQLGTGEEIYERPRTEFVARFIGQTNLVPGVLEPEPGRVRCAGVVLRTNGQGDANAAPGTPVTVSIRPYDIRIDPHGQKVSNGVAASPEANVLVGQITRSYYLGATRDYQVELRDEPGLVLRVVAPPEPAFKPGDLVTLRAPVGKCRLLATSP
jgi:iron(III) transport system ATP-binding protein